MYNTKNKLLKVNILFFFLLLSLNSLYGGYGDGTSFWVSISPSWMTDLYLCGIDVGTGRNDGKSRIYTVAFDSSTTELCEHYFYSGGWPVVVVDSETWPPSSVFTGVVVGKGRNDTINRVYVGSFEHIYEYTFNGSTWDKVDISSVSGYYTGYQNKLTIVSGRNDGLNSIYEVDFYGGKDGHITEFRWSGSSCVKTDVGFVTGSEYWSNIAIGDGRNDGINRLYSISGGCGNGVIYEFTYSGGVWNKNPLNVGNSFGVGIAVGKGRNDNVNRIYAIDYPQGIYEITYSGGMWTKIKIGDESGDFKLIILGDGRNDGINRVYYVITSGLPGEGDTLYELSFSGGKWYKSKVDSQNLSFNNMIIGKGCWDDETNRIFVTYWSSGISKSSVIVYTYPQNGYTISGIIKDKNGSPLNGIRLDLSGGDFASITTDSSGQYTFHNLIPGKNYIIVPYKEDWYFDPAKKMFNGLNSNQIQDFVARESQVASGELKLVGNLLDLTRNDQRTIISYNIPQNGKV
ncbi:MAG: carboxypeptidase-like regulatory domain-containing protein, partial [Elusimicrobiota bacterium]